MAHFFLLIFSNLVNIPKTERGVTNNMLLTSIQFWLFFVMPFVLRERSGLNLQFIFCLEKCCDYWIEMTKILDFADRI